MPPCNHFRLKIVWEMVLMYSKGLSWTKFLPSCMHLCFLTVKISLGLDKIIGNIARSMSVPIKYNIVHFCKCHCRCFWTLSVLHTLCADWWQINGVLSACLSTYTCMHAYADILCGWVLLTDSVPWLTYVKYYLFVGVCGFLCACFSIVCMHNTCPLY